MLRGVGVVAAVMCLGAAGGARAQDVVSRSVGDAVALDPPTPGVDDGADLGGQYVSGVFGQILGGGLGGGIVALGLLADDVRLHYVAAGVGIFVGCLGAAAAVDVVGDANGGNGDFWATFLGQVIGGLTAVTFGILLFGTGGDAVAHPLAIATILALPPAGATVAYDISSTR